MIIKKYNKFLQKDTLVNILYKKGLVLEKENYEYNNFYYKQGKRIKSCTHQINHFLKQENVEIKENIIKNKNYKHFSNLLKCKSSMNCPVCSERLAMAKSEDINTLKEIIKQKGDSVGFIVLTVQNNFDESLQEIANRLEKTYRGFIMSKPFKSLKKELKITSISRGLEITVAIKNRRVKFHPHYNLFITFEGKIPNNIEFNLEVSNRIYNIYNKYYLKYYNKKLRKPYIDKGKNGNIVVKGGVSFMSDFSASYLTKWGIETELTGGVFKTIDIKNLNNLELKGLHPFQLLDLYRIIKDEKMKTIIFNKYLDYFNYVYRKRFFTFSTVLKKLYPEFKNRTDEEALEDMERTGSLFFKIKNEIWEFINLTGEEKQEILSIDNVIDLEEYITTKVVEEENNRKRKMKKMEEITKKNNIKNEKQGPFSPLCFEPL